jgi:hypothetical protein
MRLPLAEVRDLCGWLLEGGGGISNFVEKARITSWEDDIPAINRAYAAVATEAEIQAGAACGQLSIITEEIVAEEELV